jgi:predicted metal-binding membrane protein
MTSTTTRRPPPHMPAVPELLRRLPPPRGIGILLFAAAAAITIAGSLSMQGMGELPMPGGWALSTAWMPMCGQSWAGAAASFTGMWAVMMVAMMLPALLPRLRHERPASAALAGAGYFLVWSVLGVVIFVLGALLTQVLLQMNAVARTVPVLSGLVVVLAGAFQFTAWKARHLACCRRASMRWSTHPIAAWRHGLRLGVHCICSCAGLTAMLLVMGVMDLRAMILVTAATTAERLAHHGERAARTVGVLAMATGALMML